MPPESAAFLSAAGRPMPASGWTSWAPEMVEMQEPVEIVDPQASFDLLGGVLSVLMWSCASLLAVWYL